MVKKTFFLSIASFYIKINFYLFTKKNYDYDLLFNIQELYNPYIVDRTIKIDFLINVFPKNEYFFLEKKGNHYLFIFERKKNKINILNNISISQFNYIITQILIELLAKTGFFFHGSVVLNKKNEALIFTGKSGSGKSTISNLLSKKFKKIADDSFFFKLENNTYFVYTNPNDFAANNNCNSELYSIIKKGFPLRRIFFIKKAEYNKIYKINNWLDLTKKMFQQIAVNENHKQTQLSSVIRFIKKNQEKIYYLYFKNDNDIVKFIEKNEKEID